VQGKTLNPERWQQIRKVFDAALEVSAGERQRFLAAACKDDAGLRLEVESLLRSHDEAGGFLESDANPPDLKDGSVAVDDPWIGKQTGAYRIVRRIGSGGMGIVYQALDTRLGRAAALKFLSTEIQRDNRARERFEREARAASALNPPNICTVYGVDEFEGHPYLAMELLKGQTLAELIHGKPLDVGQMVELAIPILSALAAAHGEGIIHRDLKPANIFLTDKGQIKILDFGLAKQTALVDGVAVPDATQSTPDLTTPGMIIGTVSYMSPEQIRAELLDGRSDLFSFGAVLYEMATGQQAFPGKMPVLVLDAILNRSPATIVESNPTFPPELAAIVYKSLEKDREKRYENAAALLKDLYAFQKSWTSATGKIASVPFRRRLAWRVPALLSILSIFALAGLYLWRHGLASSSLQKPAETPQTTARPSIAVLGFENLSGRPEHFWLSTAFSEMLSTELASGGRMRVASGEDVARARKDLGLGHAQTYSTQTLAKLRKDLGIDYVVTGSYLDSGPDSGGQLRLDARLQDARTGEILASLPETGTELNLIELLSRTGADLRAKLGTGDIAGTEITKVAATIPKDPVAARLYSEGLEKLRQLDLVGARASLLTAVVIEPDHALIHAALAEAWSQSGYDEKSRNEARRAASLAGQLPQSEQLWVEGRFRESIHEWDKAIDIYRTLLGLYPDNLEYALRLAAVETSAGRPKEAMATIATMRKLPVPVSSDPRIDLAQANADEVAADFKHEGEIAAHAVEEARNRGARLLAARAQYAQAWAALNMGEMDRAWQLANDSRSTYVSVGDLNGEASMVRTLGTIRLMQGDLSAALVYYKDSLRLASAVGNRYSEGAAINQIATTLEREGKHSEALEQYQKTLAIMREVGNRFAESIALNNIANILWARGDLEAAREMYDRAEAIAQQLGDKSGEAGADINIAHILFQQGDLKGSEARLQRAVPLAREIGERAILAEAINSLGEIRLAQDNLAEARDRCQEALTLREALADQLGLGETRVSIAELRLAEGQPVEAEKLLHQALEAFRKANSQDQEISTVGDLSRSLLDQNKIAEALKAVNGVRVRAESAEDPYVRSSFLIEAARVDAFSGNIAKARGILTKVSQMAISRGFVILQLKERLAAAEIEDKKGDHLKGDSDLKAIHREAQLRGLMLIARQAVNVRGQ
jgi:serine/threonine protein kinase/Tfp pilus assembly protein PilF